MGVYVRILMYVLSGMLLKAGLPQNLVDTIMGDAEIRFALEQGLLMLVGLMTGWIALAWRKISPPDKR